MAIKEKFQTVKEKGKNLYKKGKEWTKEKVVDPSVKFITENPWLIMPLASATAMVIGAASAADKAATTRCLSRDKVTGEKFLLQHPITNNEILELGDRMEGGQSKGEALSDMGLLRKEKKRK